jgi:hypothetical protein
MPEQKENGKFVVFADALYEHVKEIVKGEDHLFVTGVGKDEMWDHYLSSFPEGSNPIFRERAEFDCGSCRQFVKAFGNVVVIRDNKIITAWDLEGLEYPYDTVSKAMGDFIRSKPVENVFVTRDNKFGTKSNRELAEDGSVTVWNHFHAEIPKSLTTSKGTSPEAVMAVYRAAKEVFERSLKELTLDAAQTILELVAQDSLYRGEEHKKAVTTFVKYKKEYDAVPEEEKVNWLWKASINNPVSKIRNSAIGTLLIDISEGVELDNAVRKFESVVAPTNYKRPKAIFTKRMVEEAEKKLVEMGFLDSLSRRHAFIEDLTVNNLLFVNRDAKKKIEGSSILDSLKEESETVNPRTFSKVEEISIANFLKNIVPKSERIEILMEGRHQSNLMSLIAPKVKDAKSMFKWNNNFSWSYCSDTADSMKQHVKAAGGKVDGVLRFSIKWNDDRKNGNDYDAHCIEPDGNLISFQQKRGHSSGGNLDVDIMHPNGVAVENITWPNLAKIQEGVHTFLVHNYSHRGGRNGFDAEIEFNGQIFSFAFHKDLKQSEKVIVAKVRYTKALGFEIVESLDSSVSTKDIWGITTNKWAEVSTLMFSPNYWDGQESNGNRHYFFMIDKCINPGNPRGFYNEFLKEELLEHKKVFEALGAKAAVAESADQLSGLGFSETQRNDVYVRVKGAFTSILKITF